MVVGPDVMSADPGPLTVLLVSVRVPLLLMLMLCPVIVELVMLDVVDPPAWDTSSTPPTPNEESTVLFATVVFSSVSVAVPEPPELIKLKMPPPPALARLFTTIWFWPVSLQPLMFLQPP